MRLQGVYLAAPALSVVINEKNCTKKTCQQVNPQPFEQFSKSKNCKFGLKTWCKSCIREDNRLARIRRPEQIAANYKKHYDVQGRNLNYIKKYGITLEDYNRMFAEQEGCCKLCGIHQSEVKQALAVDHNKVTKEVRGLLCFECNTGIGKLKDNAELCLKAYNYLKGKD